VPVAGHTPHPRELLNDIILVAQHGQRYLQQPDKQVQGKTFQQGQQSTASANAQKPHAPVLIDCVERALNI
jgi:hypothetical protein